MPFQATTFKNVHRGTSSNSASTNWNGRLVGVHCSVAGGLHRAIERGQALGCTAIQIFVKNSNRWMAPPLTSQAIECFQTAKEHASMFVISHAGYLINLASSDAEVIKKSMESMRTELVRAENLTIPLVVLHPGAHRGDGVRQGIRRLTDRLNIIFEETVFSNTKILIEGTSGQGTTLGSSFEELRDIMAGIREIDRVGICLDTAHLFAAGYNLRGHKSYHKVWEDFDRIVGRKWLTAIHLNDSQKPLGSKVDRHENLGKGTIGSRTLARIFRDSNFADLPMVCETNPGRNGTEHRKNMNTLQRWLKK